MRNKRFFIVLVGALLFGLLAAVSVSRYLSSAQAYTKKLDSRRCCEGRDSGGHQDHSRATDGGPVSKRVDP